MRADMKINVRKECQDGFHELEPLVTEKRGSYTSITEFYCKHCLESITISQKDVMLMDRKNDKKEAKKKTKQPV